VQQSQDEDGFVNPDTIDMDVDEEDGEIDSDDALGESDEEKFKDFAFRGSGNPRDTNPNGFASKRKTAADFMSDSEDQEEQQNGDLDSDAESALEKMSMESDGEDDDFGDDGEDDSDRLNGMDDELSQSSEEGDIDDESEADEDEDGDDGGKDTEQLRRAELRKIMNEEQKSVVASISQAAKADAEKGNAVKQQRKAFDSLLNVRIRLQKALVATNSMAASEDKDDQTAVDAEPYQAAEEAAIKLLNSLNAMRHELDTAGASKAGQKRKYHKINIDTPTEAIWQTLKTSESSAVPQRQVTLEKWSEKVRGATATPISRKLNQTAAQTITQVLEDQLSNPERLVKRTKMPRSCAPVQAKSKVTEDVNIYDDADFYQLLLKELVDQRMVDSNSSVAPVGGSERPIAQWTAVKEAKTKKNVDTKASKGRKMKFTVHEKLQNFMAPEARGNWEQDRIDRFYSTLLGQQMTLGEDEAEGSDEDDEPLADEGLAFFRS
jgi:protein AATF/BFR2